MSQEKLKVVLLSETYAPDMGYLENVLPEYMSLLGMEVHVVTMDLQPYYQYSSGIGDSGIGRDDDRLTPGTVRIMDGYSVHVLGHKKRLGYMRMTGLFAKLRELRPDIVQTTAAIGWTAMDAAMGRLLLGYRLFTGSHNAASGFRPAREGYQSFAEYLRDRCTRYIPGRMVSLLTSKCYASTSDCAEIAYKFFGVQRAKTETMHLGVDTRTFRPIISDEDIASRRRVREGLGFSPDDIVCIYTGKLTMQKNAIILGRAIEILRLDGRPFRGLFVGNGEEATRIATVPGSTVMSSIPFRHLVKYYQAADIAVWTGNESISTLDAAACGIPVIISDAVRYREHIDGNGLVFRFGDIDDLCRQLHYLMDPDTRRLLGSRGADKMRTGWSWESRARQRRADYQAALGDRK
jgi:glycosyltransferase involved in cell wall biosynthesis